MQYHYNEALSVWQACDDAFTSARRSYDLAKDDLDRRLASSTIASSTVGTDGNVEVLSVEQFYAAEEAIANAIVRCNIQPARSTNPPLRQSYGSFLGVAGFATSWLLGSESLQVATITGLIGFGLLGSLVSHFVNADAGTADAGRTTVADQGVSFNEVGKVVFVGFCAAFIAYLGSYGGLAILSVEGDDPNPYVVFFGCLVGAAFSGVIWEKAKKVISTQ